MTEKKAKCPECGSNKTVRAGFKMTRQGRKQRHQCKACGLTFTKRVEVDAKIKEV